MAPPNSDNVARDTHEGGAELCPHAGALLGPVCPAAMPPTGKGERSSLYPPTKEEKDPIRHIRAHSSQSKPLKEGTNEIW